MEVQEKKIGRVFRAKLNAGEDFFEEIYKFAKQKDIKEASLFVIGAIAKGQMVTGFKNLEGDLDRRGLGEKREFFSVGTLTQPSERPNAIPKHVPWDEPKPYVHLHLTLGPDVGAEYQEVLVGHLDSALIVGAFVDIYELI